MGIDITAEVNKVKEDFRKYSVRAKTSLEKALVKAAMKVEADAKKLFRGRDDVSAPGLPPRVDTGRLRASITHRLANDDTGPVAEVGTNVEYGVWLEYGTSRMQPHPFMGPALEMNAKEIEDFLAGAVKDAEQ